LVVKPYRDRQSIEQRLVGFESGRKNAGRIRNPPCEVTRLLRQALLPSAKMTGMRLRVGMVLAMVAVVLWILPIQSTEAEQARKITIFYTGFVRGSYGPCG